MKEGWSAKGLLLPLWQTYPGKRDGLAKAVGTSPNSLSAINTGRRNVAYDLGSRLAAELGVSLQELGAPEDAGAVPLTLVGRVERLEAESEQTLRLLLAAFELLDLELFVPNDGDTPTVRRTTRQHGRRVQ